VNPIVLVILIITGGIVGTLWLYVTARFVTRGIMRTLKNMKRSDNDESQA